ncbi:MAG TPA: Holliday junction resolvase RuvX [Candidatus Omnitrophota bacterium]|nr:Holliday junction resolvase RuvX [Candidatus Omnitrophota bacterium]
MVILGLDFGSKRIGVARTDALGMMAHAVGIVERKKNEQTVAELCDLVLKWNAEKIVFGLPRNMNGTLGKSAEEVKAFAELMREKLPGVEIGFWDERLSTSAVSRAMTEAGVSSRKQRGKLDSLAAQWILQGYLDSLPRTGGGLG